MSPILLDIICDTFNTDGPALSDDLDIRDLEEWDSLTHMLFITSLEKQFAIQLSGDDIVEMQTISNIRQILRDNHNIDT